jgi:NTP pyrophosphatase (non-canonical NTP hydrolase)
MSGKTNYFMNHYQEVAHGTAVYPNNDKAIAYVMMGLNEEAGEAAGKVKRYYRGDVPELNKEALALELGDTLWYLAEAAGLIGYTLSDIADMNIKKLQDRKARGVTKGSGDVR